MFFLAMLLLCRTGATAQQRSEAAAMQIARQFFVKSGKSPRLAVVPHQRVAAQVQRRVAAAGKVPAQSQSFYVVNDEANNRFVLVSADERLHTILGYSDHGVFDENEAPAGLLELLQGYDAQYAALLSGGAGAPPARKAVGKDIAPLIPSRWRQDAPFNDDCPENKMSAAGERSAAGCVATAMAQVMNYYKYPVQGQGGTYSYTTATQSIPQSFCFDELTLDWNNILDCYDESSTQLQNAEVAKLMHACGVSVSMDYGLQSDGQSGACAPNIPYAMTHYFGYNPNVVYYERAYFSDNEWNEVIMEELESSRPILYSGKGWSGGHQFILDGCNAEGMYHFNFGWEGAGDGYFEIDALNPLILFDYSSEQTMVRLITPGEAGKHEDVFYSRHFTLNKADISETTVGSSIKFEFAPVCYSSNSTYNENRVSTFGGKLGIGLYDSNFNYVQSLKEYDVSELGIGEGYSIVSSITLHSGTFKDGEYYIAPFAQATESRNPTRIRTPKGERDWYYVTVADGNVKLAVGGSPTSAPVPSVAVGDYNVSASNKDGAKEAWNIKVWQDSEEAGKYWISNLDPAVAKKGYGIELGWNKVYGYMNESHTQLSVPVNQEIGEGIVIRNITGGDNIAVQLAEKDGKMYFSGINDLWGSKELSADTEMSRYRYTTIAYGKIDDENPDPTPVAVETPSVDVSSNSFTLHCGTEGAAIYYTTDNATPGINSTQYDGKPVPLHRNCTIKATACKDGQWSGVATCQVASFKVATPVVHQDGNTVTFTCATEGASVYYDWDGTERQSGTLEITKSGVIKVYAEKDGYNRSDVREQSLEYMPGATPEPGPGVLVVAGNEAGKLPARISEADRLAATRLTVSGELNGTDIVFIRGMFENGKLTDLDMENATIVSGGDAYSTTPDFVTKDRVVSQYLFEDCRQMISVKLPANTVKIESGAFAGCKSLKRLDIPAACVEVERFMASRCDNLEEISLSDSVRTFPGLAVYLCKNLVRITAGEGNPCFKSVDGVLYSKDGAALVRYPMGKSGEAYSIPQGVTVIGKDAFSGAQFASVDIPNTVRTIEPSAFESCSNLQSLVIPNSVSAVGESAFLSCGKLDNVTMSSEVDCLKSGVFSGCKNLRKFHVGAKVSEVHKLAFYNCQSLQAFEVDESSQFFAAPFGVLYTKDMRELVKCPMALYAEEYIVPNGVGVIRAEAFASCTNIRKFNLPGTLTAIGECAFERCEMSSIVIPQTVTDIGNSAFNRCENLESLVLPEGTQEIRSLTLHGCKSLSYVYIPAGVTEFGMWAIADCPSLTMINSQITDIDKVKVNYSSYDACYDAFADIPADCTWRVPAGGAKGTAGYDKYAALYRAQPWWVSTWQIVIDDTTLGVKELPASDCELSLDGGTLSIKPARDGAVCIYTPNGTLVQRISVKEGEASRVALPPGMYVINGKKVVLK